jgi:hypothetical protein
MRVWQKTIDGVKIRKDFLPVIILSGGKDFSIETKDGKSFSEVYRLYAVKGDISNCEYFRPDFPENEAIKITLKGQPV